MVANVAIIRRAVAGDYLARAHRPPLFKEVMAMPEVFKIPSRGCPNCGRAVPASQPRCAACGFDLAAPPAPYGTPPVGQPAQAPYGYAAQPPQAPQTPYGYGAQPPAVTGGPPIYAQPPYPYGAAQPGGQYGYAATNPASLWSYDGSTWRAWAAMGLLGACALMDVLAVFSGLAQASLLTAMQSGERFPQEALVANDLRHGAIALLGLAAFVVTAIFFLIWIHRAHKNLPALGAQGLQFTPGWAVGYFFVPFLNLVRPYQIASEIWRASDPDRMDATGWRASAASPLIVTWWLVYLLSGFTGEAVLFGAADRTLPGLISQTITGVASSAVGIASAVLAIFVVRGIQLRQEEKYRRLQRGAVVTASYAGYAGRPMV